MFSNLLFPYNVMFKINYIFVDGNVSEVGDKGLKTLYNSALEFVKAFNSPL